jgi:hypothetical protein
MKKVKLLFSKVLGFFKKCKVKKPKQTDLKKSNDNDEFAGKDQVKEKKESNEIITSQPYIVKIENTTDTIIENIPLFFANNQNQLLYTEKGDYKINGLIISSGISNVSYRQISNQLAIEKITVGLTYINSENNHQVLEKFSIEQNDANGNFSCKVISPTVDPFQSQSKIVALKEKFSLDGNTSIVLHKVHPRTVLMIYFYPSKIFKN